MLAPTTFVLYMEADVPLNPNVQFVNREVPLKTFSAYVFVMVSFVPAIGGPAMVTVDAVAVVTDVLVAVIVGAPKYVL